MTLIEYALQDIDRRLEEARARLADAQKEVAWLEQERQTIVNDSQHEQQQAAASRRAARQ